MPKQKSKKSVLTREAFLQLDDSLYREVEIPRWGTARIRSLTGSARDNYIKAQGIRTIEGIPQMNTEDAEARLLALTLVDADGELLFPDVDEGIRVLRDKNAQSLQKAYYVALELAGLQEEAVAKAEELLEETQSVGHGSA